MISRSRIVLAIALSIASLHAFADNTTHVYGPGGPAPAMKEAATAFEKQTGTHVDMTAGPTPKWIDSARRGRHHCVVLEHLLITHGVSMSNVSNIGNSDLEHLLAKAGDAAKSGPSGMSTGEQLAVALILDRPDWLRTLGCTIAEAMERVGPDWLRLIPAVARRFVRERDEAAYAAAEKARQARIAQFVAQQSAGEEMDFAATLITYGDAPGYRDVRFTFDLEPTGAGPRPTVRTCISIRPEDGERMVCYITGVHRFAWDRSGGRPIDAKPDEQRPSWLDNA